MWVHVGTGCCDMQFACYKQNVKRSEGRKVEERKVGGGKERK
jgi:hypothetical protein